MDRVEYKPDRSITYFRVAIICGILNAPFIGVYKNVCTLNFNNFSMGLFLAALSFSFLSIIISKMFMGIYYGYDNDGVFKKGLIKKKRIKWIDINKIYESNEIDGYTESDFFPFKKAKNQRRTFVVQSENKELFFESYNSFRTMKDYIVSKLNLDIEERETGITNFIINQIILDVD